MSGRIHLSAPDVTPLEEAYVVRALRSGWVAPVGPDVSAFEEEIAQRIGVPHALAVSSGTAALHLALLAVGAKPGTAVVVPTLTFVATANAVVYTGAEPVFVDCVPETGHLDIGLLADLLERLRREHQPVAAVVSVDLFGCCPDYGTLTTLCAQYGIPVVEDAAEALGASHDGLPAGAFGRLSAFSFNGNKVMTTSGGGMLLSADADLVTRCRYLSGQARLPVRHYEHGDIGYNYRLSNLLAALGRAQLRRLDDMIARRRLLRERYAKLFAGQDGIRLLDDRADGNCWLTVVVVDPDRAGWHADDLAAWLGERNIETRPVFKPLHLQPVFVGARSAMTGAAARLFDTGLALPSGSALTDAEMDRVRSTIESFLDGYR